MVAIPLSLSSAAAHVLSMIEAVVCYYLVDFGILFSGVNTSTEISTNSGYIREDTKNKINENRINIYTYGVYI